MIKVALYTGTLVFSVVFGFLSASAAPVYDNPYIADGNASGLDATQYVEASSFSLGAATAITGGTVAVAGLGDLSDWDGSFNYWIFSDSSGSPASSSLYDGVATVNSVTDTGTNWMLPGNIWSIDFDFSESLAVDGSTTYWLGIHLAENFDDLDNIFWVDSTTDSGSAFSPGVPFEWQSATPARAFTLRNDPIAPIPLPAALPLLLSALGVFGFFGWRRRQMATA